MRNLVWLALVLLSACGEIISEGNAQRSSFNVEVELTDVRLAEYYAVASSALPNGWGENRLELIGQRSRGKDFEFVINNDSNTCLYHFKAVLTNGHVLTSSYVNLCHSEAMYYTHYSVRLWPRYRIDSGYSYRD